MKHRQDHTHSHWGTGKTQSKDRDGKNPWPFLVSPRYGQEFCQFCCYFITLFYFILFLWCWALNPGPCASELAITPPLNYISPCPWLYEAGSDSLPQLNLPHVLSASITNMCDTKLPLKTMLPQVLPAF